MKHEVTTEEFSFAALATILTGRTFGGEEFLRLCAFLTHDSPAQVMANREDKWIPWLLVQFPFFARINPAEITDDNAMQWLADQEKIYKGQFLVRAVRLK